MRDMVCNIIDSFGEKGVGLGSQISQLLAISYLSALDHKIKEKLHIRHYIRYSDDMVLIHPDKQYLQTVRKEIKIALNELGLEFNPKSSLHKLEQGINFLKFKFILTNSGKVHVAPLKDKYMREKQKIRHMINKNVSISEIFKSFISWASFLMQGNVSSQIHKIHQSLINSLKNHLHIDI